MFNKKIFVCFFGLLIGCGNTKEPSEPNINSDSLLEQVERIEELSLWCDGVPAFPFPHPISKIPNCAVGDGVSNAGFAALYGNADAGVMPETVDVNGRPWRAPSYVGLDTSNSYSRDQYIGLLEWTLKTGRKEALQAVFDYEKRTGRLCPDDTDDRCDLAPNGSPSLVIRTHDILGLPVQQATRNIDHAIVLGEARTSKGYQSVSVSRKIMLSIFTGHPSPEFTKAAKILKDKSPNNLWFDMVYHITNGSDQSEFERIGKSLVECMKLWNGTKGADWAWDQDVCDARAHGADLAAMGRYLLNERGLR